MMSNAELIARLLQSNPLGAELLCKDYENIEFHVSNNAITDIYISQARCTYEIQLKEGNSHKYAMITIISVDNAKHKVYVLHLNEPLKTLISTCNELPGIDIILEPRTAPSFDVLRRYAYKVHEYCKNVTSCNDCGFENKTEHCPFRRPDDVGLCPSEWIF